MTRIKEKFVELKQQRKTGLVTYIMAADPDLKTSQEILNLLPQAGADIIELGMPFSDPMADGPVIQNAAIRALKNKAKLAMVFDMVKEFRKKDNKTPIILMGYINLLAHLGLEKFVLTAKNSGVDGLIIVDLPPEEDNELLALCDEYEIDLIKLATPTSDAKRLEIISKKARGFIYYVTVTGTTGGASASSLDIEKAVNKIKTHTDLPIVAGFGIKNHNDVNKLAGKVDAVVVGSALVAEIGQSKTLAEISQFVSNLN